MTLLWQNLVVALVVLLAGGYLWIWFHRRSRSGSCSQCPLRRALSRTD